MKDLPPLPKLPPNYFPDPRYGMSHEPAYTAEQMRSYGEQCRREAIEEAARMAEAERLEEPTHHADDIAYNIAISHCAASIRSLIQEGE